MTYDHMRIIKTENIHEPRPSKALQNSYERSRAGVRHTAACHKAEFSKRERKTIHSPFPD